jgi:DNA processing protein
MDRQAVCAVLARAPALRAHHVNALVAAVGGDLTRSIGLEAVNRVELPRGSGSRLLYPDTTLLAEDLRWIERSGAHLLASTEPGFPPQLLQLPDAPAVVFVLGDPRALLTPQLAMVGSRHASTAGRRRAHGFARYLVKAGLTITSGLALGIDAASHEGALRDGGATIAVCGTGLDIIYPTQHHDLARRICGNGALLSEFPPATPPLRMNFPRRNRLISALSCGTVVVEAALQSGSLITARHAMQLGRAVFAIPGAPNDAGSRGCHQLIRDGAALVESPSEVLLRLKIPLPNEGVVGPGAQPGARGAMDKGYEMLLDAVGFEPATVDVIALRTGLTGEAIASMLLALELEGHVAPYPGGRFGRIS